MIWVLLAILIFGGGGSSMLADQLKQDEQHAKENPRKATLEVAWGNLALTAPIEATVPE